MDNRSNHADVGLFHEKFGLDNTACHPPGPRVLPSELIDFRLNFIDEEVEELHQGLAANDPAAVADALVDLAYVVHGFAHLLGLPWQELWDAVQAANMAKERATDATQTARGGTFDVVKPAGWTPPDVRGILRAHGWSLD